MRKVLCFLIIFFPFYTLYTVSAWAQLGAGVGLGKIELKEPLTPGGVYALPSLPVINTGEIAATYEVEAIFVSSEPASPKGLAVSAVERYFSFSPRRFHLNPNESRQVKVTITLPFTAPAGQYRVLLEAHTVSKTEGGNVAIGPAAAARLNFSVGTAPGVLGAIRQRVVTLWNFYLPWSLFFVLALDFLAILYLLRFVVPPFEISIRRKKERQEKLPL